MTTEQTRRVREKVLAFTRDWMLEQNAADGRYGGAAAFADLGRDHDVSWSSLRTRTAGGESSKGEFPEQDRPSMHREYGTLQLPTILSQGVSSWPCVKRFV